MNMMSESIASIGMHIADLMTPSNAKAINISAITDDRFSNNNGGMIIGSRRETQAPPLPAVSPVKPTTHMVEVIDRKYLEEYTKVATEVGVLPSDLAIESFKLVLLKLDFPVYALSEVVAYMDAKAAVESKEQSGWCWKNLRAKDHISLRTFGTSARRDRFMQIDDFGTIPVNRIRPASDYYAGDWAEDGKEIYPHIVPLHALKRVAAIERNFDGASFLVSDYALAPEIKHPDPFLMAVIPNANLRVGVGRFVIDFWDEPGFGIKEMLAR